MFIPKQGKVLIKKCDIKSWHVKDGFR